LLINKGLTGGKGTSQAPNIPPNQRKDITMENILELILTSDLDLTHNNTKNSPTYETALKTAEESNIILRTQLKDDLLKTFADYEKSKNDLSKLSNNNHYISGYRLGVLMTLEIFNCKDDLFIAEKEKFCKFFGS